MTDGRLNAEERASIRKSRRNRQLNESSNDPTQFPNKRDRDDLDPTSGLNDTGDVPISPVNDLPNEVAPPKVPVAQPVQTPKRQDPDIADAQVEHQRRREIQAERTRLIRERRAVNRRRKRGGLAPLPSLDIKRGRKNHLTDDFIRNFLDKGQVTNPDRINRTDRITPDGQRVQNKGSARTPTINVPLNKVNKRNLEDNQIYRAPEGKGQGFFRFNAEDGSFTKMVFNPRGGQAQSGAFEIDSSVPDLNKRDFTSLIDSKIDFLSSVASSGITTPGRQQAVANMVSLMQNVRDDPFLDIDDKIKFLDGAFKRMQDFEEDPSQDEPATVESMLEDGTIWPMPGTADFITLDNNGVPKVLNFKEPIAPKVKPTTGMQMVHADTQNTFGDRMTDIQETIQADAMDLARNIARKTFDDAKYDPANEIEEFISGFTVDTVNSKFEQLITGYALRAAALAKQALKDNPDDFFNPETVITEDLNVSKSRFRSLLKSNVERDANEEFEDATGFPSGSQTNEELNLPDVPIEQPTTITPRQIGQITAEMNARSPEERMKIRNTYFPDKPLTAAFRPEEIRIMIDARAKNN